MATETTNYKLKKPDQKDFYDINIINENMNVIDTEMKKLDDNKLNSSGGNVTGTITQSAEVGMNRPTNSGSLTLVGGKTWEDGAYAKLFGKDAISNKGEFVLRSSDGVTASHLFGKPDGELIWNDKNIVRSVNGSTADASGNVKITGLSVTADIPNGSDLNAYKTNGTYTVGSNTAAESITNIPVATAGTLEVKPGAVAGNYVQEYTTYNPDNPKKFIRTYYYHSAAWGAWKQFATTNNDGKNIITSVNNVAPDANGNVMLTAKDVGAFGFLTDGQGGDLNSFTTMGVKSVISPTNKPKGTSNIGLVWNICSQDGMFVNQFYLDASTRGIFTRNLYDDAWTGWLSQSVTVVPATIE